MPPCLQWQLSQSCMARLHVAAHSSARPGSPAAHIFNCCQLPSIFFFYFLVVFYQATLFPCMWATQIPFATDKCSRQKYKCKLSKAAGEPARWRKRSKKSSQPSASSHKAAWTSISGQTYPSSSWGAASKEACGKNSSIAQRQRLRKSRRRHRPQRYPWWTHTCELWAACPRWWASTTSGPSTGWKSSLKWSALPGQALNYLQACEAQPWATHNTSFTPLK